MIGGTTAYTALSSVLRVYVTLFRCLPRMAYRVRLPPEIAGNTEESDEAACECCDATLVARPAFHMVLCEDQRIRRRQFVLNMLCSLRVKNDEPQQQCAVCLCPLSQEGCDRRTLRCGHSFHHHCIVQWLLHSVCMTCPLCRDTPLLSAFSANE